MGPAMPDAELLSLARNLLARAEEIWTRAETFHDADARQKLHKIATTYVKLGWDLMRLQLRYDLFVKGARSPGERGYR